MVLVTSKSVSFARYLFSEASKSQDGVQSPTSSPPSVGGACGGVISELVGSLRSTSRDAAFTPFARHLAKGLMDDVKERLGWYYEYVNQALVVVQFVPTEALLEFISSRLRNNGRLKRPRCCSLQRDAASSPPSIPEHTLSHAAQVAEFVDTLVTWVASMNTRTSTRRTLRSFGGHTRQTNSKFSPCFAQCDVRFRRQVLQPRSDDEEWVDLFYAASHGTEDEFPASASVSVENQ